MATRYAMVLAVTILMQSTLATAAAAPATPQSNAMVLWYSHPAGRWLESLPVGNGRLGVMVFGGIEKERLALNESTFWSGAPSDRYENPEGHKHLAEIRQLFFAGKYKEAVGLTGQYLIGRKDNFGTHLPVGDLWLHTRHPAGEVRDYRRDLDIDQGVAHVEYTVAGVRFKREVLATHVEGIAAVRLTADKPGQISFQAKLTAGGNRPWTVKALGQNTLVLSGDAYENLHSDGRCGVAMQGLLRVLPEGGRMSAVGDSLDVQAADSATVLVAINTNYKGRDPAQLCQAQMTAAAKQAYNEIRTAHVADHQRLFRRVKIDLGGSEASATPTDERLKSLRVGKDDPQLLALFFQYGRYLLIAGSREDSPLPLNLQGIWNDNLCCNMGWTCDYHLDINIEQNYWPTEVCNLIECHQPLFGLIESLREPGRRTAKLVYD